ncbi:hypothetical protein LTR28_006611 [Elasticomyces elasticus]|nr:hypothetical protein LTR28_006611 [Elasticomyces elasticus]
MGRSDDVKLVIRQQPKEALVMADGKEKDGGFFVFGDVSVKKIGKHRLRFSLFDMRKAGGEVMQTRLLTSTSTPTERLERDGRVHMAFEDFLRPRSSTGLKRGFQQYDNATPSTKTVAQSTSSVHHVQEMAYCYSMPYVQATPPYDQPPTKRQKRSSGAVEEAQPMPPSHVAPHVDRQQPTSVRNMQENYYGSGAQDTPNRTQHSKSSIPSRSASAMPNYYAHGADGSCPGRHEVQIRASQTLHRTDNPGNYSYGSSASIPSCGPDFAGRSQVITSSNTQYSPGAAHAQDHRQIYGYDPQPSTVVMPPQTAQSNNQTPTSNFIPSSSSPHAHASSDSIHHLHAPTQPYPSLPQPFNAPTLPHAPHMSGQPYATTPLQQYHLRHQPTPEQPYRRAASPTEHHQHQHHQHQQPFDIYPTNPVPTTTTTLPSSSAPLSSDPIPGAEHAGPYFVPQHASPYPPPPTLGIGVGAGGYEEQPFQMQRLEGELELTTFSSGTAAAAAGMGLERGMGRGMGQGGFGGVRRW